MFAHLICFSYANVQNDDDYNGGNGKFDLVVHSNPRLIEHEMECTIYHWFQNVPKFISLTMVLNKKLDNSEGENDGEMVRGKRTHPTKFKQNKKKKISNVPKIIHTKQSTLVSNHQPFKKGPVFNFCRWKHVPKCAELKWWVCAMCVPICLAHLSSKYCHCLATLSKMTFHWLQILASYTRITLYFGLNRKLWIKLYVCVCVCLLWKVSIFSLSDGIWRVNVNQCSLWIIHRTTNPLTMLLVLVLWFEMLIECVPHCRDMAETGSNAKCSQFACRCLSLSCACV